MLGQPQDAGVGRGGAVSLRFEVFGASPVSYRWEHDGTPVAGAGGAELRLDPARASDAGVYRCFATGPAGEIASRAATVSVCIADFNGDGFLDFDDYIGFVGAFEGGGEAGDANGDGFVDFFDYADFVARFEAGCTF